MIISTGRAATPPTWPETEKMETRASHILVGGFVLGLTALLVGFIIWLTQTNLSEGAQKYAILFDRSVAGLQEGSQVRYRGVLVGSVDAIELDPEDGGEARITISVNASTPIKEDTSATLEMKGVTGGTFVQLTGGSPESALLQPRHFGDIPVIASQASSIDALMEGASGILSPENQQNISEILVSIRDLAGQLAKASPQVPETLATVREATTSLKALTEDLRKFANNAGATTTTLGSDLGNASRELAETATAIRELTASVNAVIAENRGPVQAFTTQGLPEFRLLMGDLRELSANLNRLTRRIEQNPRDFVFGGSHEGVKVEP